VAVWTANGVIVALALLLLWRARRRDRPSRVRAWLASPRRRWLARRGASRAGSPAGAGSPEAAPGVAHEVAGEIVSLGGTSTRFIGLIDLYVMRAYGRVLLLSLAAAYLIFALVTLQGLMEDLLRSQQPASLIAEYYVYFMPTVFADVLPVACLTGSIVAFTGLARSSELVALMASGMGLRRATAPVLLATLGLCGVLFVVQNQIAPAAHRRAGVVEDRITGRSPKTYGASMLGQWTFGPGGRLLRYGLYDPDRREFRDLHVFTLDRAGERPRVVDHRFAQRARWAGHRWELENGWFRTFEPPSFKLHDGPHVLPIDLPEDLVEQRMKTLDKGHSDELSLAELTGEIERVESSGYDGTRLRVAFHARYARALAPLVMVLLGVPFAFKIGRRGSLYGVGVALLLVIVYWAAFAVFNALGLETLLHPAVAAWAPNVFFGLLGSSLLLHVRT
jgi:LPS export ABC transporter permease LptG